MFGEGKDNKTIDDARIYQETAGQEYQMVEKTLSDFYSIQSLASQIKQKRKALDLNKQNLELEGQKIENLQAELDSYKNSGDYDNYNKLVLQYNNLVENYQVLQVDFNAQIVSFNLLVEKYNSLQDNFYQY